MIRFAGVVEGFEEKDRSAFTESEAGAVAVERPGFLPGGGLESVESSKNEFAQCVVAAADYPAGPASTDELKGVTDGVGAGGAGVREDPQGGVDPEGSEGVENGLLRDVAADEAGVAGGEDVVANVAVKVFAEGHATAGGPHHDKIGIEVRNVREGFADGEQIHSGGAGLLVGAGGDGVGGGEPAGGDLAGGLGPAVGDVEGGDRRHAIACFTESGERFRCVGAER